MGHSYQLSYEIYDISLDDDDSMSGLRGAGYWVCRGVGGLEGRGGYVGCGRFKRYSFRRV